MNRVERPQYIRWRTIDLLACDALITWPQMERTGLRPAFVASGGGVSDEHWISERYRVFRAGAINYKPPEGLFPDALIELPQQWRFEAAANSSSEAQEVELLRAIARAEPLSVEGLVQELKQRRPHLSSGDRVFMPFARSGWDTLWIYVDENLLTDRWLTTHSTSEMFSHSWKLRPNFRCIVGSIDRRKNDYIDFGSLTPIRMSDRRREDGVVHESGVFSSAQDARFRELLEEAIWCWRDCTTVVADLSGKVHQIVVKRPIIAEADRIAHYGGVVSSVPMIVARTEAAVSDAFSDVPAAEREMRSLGRFRFDVGAGQMVDVLSGESLAFEASIEGKPNAFDAQLAIFHYRDAEGECRVQVQRDARTQSHVGAPWLVDYSTMGTVATTSESRWRRINTFLLDALLLWPDSEKFGPRPSALLACGGWFNGEWQPSLRRKIRANLRLGNDDEGDFVAATITHGKRWRLVSGPKSVRSRRPTAPLPSVTLDPPGDIAVPTIDLGAFARRELSDRGYYMREDNGALLYVCGWRTVPRGPDGDLVDLPVYQYCDSAVRVRLHQHFDFEMTLAYVHDPRVVVHSGPSEGQPELPASLLRKGMQFIEPTEALWRRLAEATEARMLNAKQKPQYKVKMTGAYIAGVLDRSATTQLWLHR